MRITSHCRCGAGLICRSPQHASHVWEGEVFCSFNCVADAQSKERTAALGIGFQPDLFRPPPRLEYG